MMPTISIPELQVTLAAVKSIATYKAEDGRRFHPDDALGMIVSLIEARHPDLDMALGAKAE